MCVYVCVCVCRSVCPGTSSWIELRVHYLAPASFSGADVQEAELDCFTEATTPTSFESTTQTSTVELDESVSQEEVPPSQETSHAEEVIPPEVEVSPTEAAADSAQPKEERDSDKSDEAEGHTDSSSQSVDELLADWREDLEAFQQMEKDELWQSSGWSTPWLKDLLKGVHRHPSLSLMNA